MFEQPLHLNRYVVDFYDWMESQGPGFGVEWATSVDLHQEADLLDHYNLVIIVFHDEYWSWEMRDHVERFVAGGGNLAVFSGNTCWWQVRFENNSMICYKVPEADIAATGIEPVRATGLWHEWPVYRPETSLHGLTYAHGGWHWFGAGRDYTIHEATHWVFDGVSVRNGDTFGEPDLISYEADGLDVVVANGVPQPTFADGAPSTLRILASAELDDWAEDDPFWGTGWSGGPAGRSGRAVMSIFQNVGTVFNSGTTQWPLAIDRNAEGPAARVTRNVIERLRERSPGPAAAPPPSVGWERIGHANRIRGLAGCDGFLWAATDDDRLWFREPWGFEVKWTPVSEANQVVAMTGSDERLFAATTDGALWTRLPERGDRRWDYIGHAIDVVGMAYCNGGLWAATTDNRLWCRTADLYDVTWEHAGHANHVVAMTASTNKLFCVDRNGVLWCRDPNPSDIPWTAIGRGDQIISMALERERLYAATSDHRLLWRAPSC